MTVTYQPAAVSDSSSLLFLPAMMRWMGQMFWMGPAGEGGWGSLSNCLSCCLCCVSFCYGMANYDGVKTALVIRVLCYASLHSLI
jgi:hypothetical protein